MDFEKAGLLSTLLLTKYVLGIFIDVAGAFDNLWWPSIFRRLRLWGLAKNTYDALRRYFENRTVTIRSKFDVVSKIITKRCP